MNAPAPGPALFWIGFGSYVLLELWIAARDRLPGVTAPRTDAGVIQITITFVGAFFLAYIALNIDSLDVDGWAPLILGLIVIAAGIALRLWAVRTLGEFFRRTVVVQEGHRVITSGPYRWVRHPSYSGAMISMAGVGLAFGNVASFLICLIVPGIAYIWRIPAEEAALQRGLGEQYSRYMEHTARLIPGVW